MNTTAEIEGSRDVLDYRCSDQEPVWPAHLRASELVRTATVRLGRPPKVVSNAKIATIQTLVRLLADPEVSPSADARIKVIFDNLGMNRVRSEDIPRLRENVRANMERYYIRENRDLMAVLAADANAPKEPLFGWIKFEVEELAIRTPSDLALLLKTAMLRADLGPGQVAKKTGIHRSQVYNLTKPERGSLPRNAEQLRTFMDACRMQPGDINTVIGQWEKLDDLRRRRLAPELPEPEPIDIATTETEPPRELEHEEPKVATVRQLMRRVTSSPIRLIWTTLRIMITSLLILGMIVFATDGVQLATSWFAVTVGIAAGVAVVVAGSRAGAIAYQLWRYRNLAALMTSNPPRFPADK